MQGLTRFGIGKLGAELFDDAHVVRVLKAVCHHERMRIRLAQQILRLVNLIGGIDGNKHRADLGGRPEGDIPLWYVGGPNGDMVALPYAQRDERAREGIHIVPELGVGTGVIERGIAERVLIREFIRHAVEHLREGEVDEGILFPDVFACLCLVIKQTAPRGGFLQILVHIVGKVREHHACVLQARRPALDPFQGYVTVIIDGAQRPHHLLDRKVALAHHTVARFAALHDGILDMHVLDVCA